jgi:regulator of cell morphogenesis and NO signaling
MNEPLGTATIGDLVATDFRTAGVFERFGIDFCCGGRRSLADACREATVDPSAVVRALDALPPLVSAGEHVADWDVDRLIEHIVTVHHGYVRQALPLIGGYLAKLERVHGARHPELAEVARHFERVSAELARHMVKEEHVLFPYVRELAARGDDCGRVPSPFGTVENPIRMMEREHRDAAAALRAIRELTANYSVPADGCTTYSVCMAELERFEHDLHRHVHLENNVLFPRAVRLESVPALGD